MRTVHRQEGMTLLFQVSEQLHSVAVPVFVSVCVYLRPGANFIPVFARVCVGFFPALSPSLRVSMLSPFL